MKPSQLTIQIRRVFRGCHADGVSLDNKKLLFPVSRYAVFIQGEDVPSDQLVDRFRRAAKMKSSGESMIDRAKAICCSLEEYFSRILMRALGSDLKTRSIFPLQPSSCLIPL